MDRGQRGEVDCSELEFPSPSLILTQVFVLRLLKSFKEKMAGLGRGQGVLLEVMWGIPAVVRGGTQNAWHLLKNIPIYVQPDIEDQAVQA